MLAPFVNELDRIAPSFRISGSQIRVLQSPSEFYETLKEKIRNAERRIFLSTLYIGKSEQELIVTLQEALRAKPDLKLSILTDALRGTREAPNPSCASLLAPLIAEFGSDRVEIRMYHTPNLTGLRKKYIPKRINEGWGLQHMKLYGVDDEIIMSGANLSNDYFTNRQDRYHLFSSKDITEYFANLQDAVSSLSFLVRPSDSPKFELVWPRDNAAPSPLEDPRQFVKESTSILSGLISPKTAPLTSYDPTPEEDKDTSVYMLAQFSQLLSPDTSTELPAVTHILRTLSLPQYANSSWMFTAGYFNPDPSLTKLLLSTQSHNNTVITASPYANGFYKSPGVSGLLPDAYTLLARRFVQAIHRHKKQDSTVLREWRKGTVGEPGGWTYHAKGLWVTLPGEENPSITMIGSSNYTKRSYSLDLEANALVVTENKELKKRLGEEQRWLKEHTTIMTRDDFATPERRVGVHVRIAMAIVKMLGGAL
ncbi:cdp-diacylglycerol-glycerol-3-phosphate 3-phosphatidyltransferase-like protein [Thermochaetoides thermophila DSM 1495]|uniref:CDP-diacylglycerol--glycerol-3-phosphate 3-phosphatidyltransferase n=1 Tax=Chaetomium thermophilum (strain DSM 1495 / CBS 144.50 / IMI 039719) TaxID=759272 RepID=G0S776_CHATD|nr:cdp-diacylglycerol-glycerol-3-phosphate 3-phosphatidyltransferase-like protein [Thermochaetoides thermophila DSM 1495]EGS20931.1 cdp-diacylglycerol-glycerol-3-phosphate 3-phosphatidyltransferase-like protein [Thermochaetoides thermophila DSM 1495]